MNQTSRKLDWNPALRGEGRKNRFAIQHEKRRVGKKVNGVNSNR
jgi:hypothetical protein